METIVVVAFAALLTLPRCLAMARSTKAAVERRARGPRITTWDVVLLAFWLVVVLALWLFSPHPA